MEAKRILIVEDDKITAEICSKHLKGRGYETVVVYDAMEALNQLKQFDPDLILLDLGLPKISGVDFYQQICTDLGYPKYPVLILTGQLESAELFREVRVDGFLTKPFSLDRLIYEVDFIINNQYWRKTDEKLKRLVIADADNDEMNRIANTFSQANYRVEVTSSGIAAIERIISNPPQVALISLNIRDIPADLAVYRIHEMVKTRDVKCLLYTRKDFKHEPSSYGQFLFEYLSVYELLDEVEVLRNLKSKV